MHGSEHKDEGHSTPDVNPRSKLWPRVLGSMALFGLLVGMMIGRLTIPDPVSLDRIEVLPDSLQLWFSAQPALHGEVNQGMLAMVFQVQGPPAAGQVLLNGKPANWQVQRGDKGLLLTVVAARKLHADWHGELLEGRWRLKVSLREE